MATRHGTLTPDTPTEVAFSKDFGSVGIVHYGDVTDPIFVTVDGTEAAAGADGTFVVLAGTRRVIPRDGGAPTEVSLVSEGAASYEVEV